MKHVSFSTVMPKFVSSYILQVSDSKLDWVHREKLEEFYEATWLMRFKRLWF